MVFEKVPRGAGKFNSFTVNGKPYPHDQEFVLKQGTRYRLTWHNRTDDAHPLHLHRHQLEIAEIYGKATSGVIKDTVVVPTYVLQGYIRDGRCRFPYTPKFLHELRMVEAEFINKYQIRVQAPLEKGSHDDMVDAAQLCAYKAQKWFIEEGGLKIETRLVSRCLFQSS